MILQAAFVATQLLFHFLGTGVKCRINLGRVCLGGCGQSGGQVHCGFAYKFMSGFGKNDQSIRGPLCILFHYDTQFGFYMRLQCFADVDLFSALEVNMR